MKAVVVRAGANIVATLEFGQKIAPKRTCSIGVDLKAAIVFFFLLLVDLELFSFSSKKPL